VILKLAVMTVVILEKNFSFDLNEIWYVEVDEWCMTVCSMTLSKVKVTSSWKLEILPFSTAVFAICNGSWQLTADS